MEAKGGGASPARSMATSCHRRPPSLTDRSSGHHWAARIPRLPLIIRCHVTSKNTFFECVAFVNLYLKILDTARTSTNYACTFE